MRKRGLTEEHIRAILVDNPKSVLTFKVTPCALLGAIATPQADVNSSPSINLDGRSARMSIFGVVPAITSAKASPMGGPSLKQCPQPAKQA